MSNDVEVQQIVFHQVKVQASNYLDGHALEHLKFEVIPTSYFVNGFLATLSTYVLAENLPPHHESKTETVVFRTPATWWDHWKLAHADTRLINRFVAWRGIRYREESQQVTLTVDLERFRSYPKAPAYVTEHMGQPVFGHYLTSEITTV